MIEWRLKSWLDWLSGRGRVEPFDDLVSAVIGGFRRAHARVRRRAIGTLQSLTELGDPATPGLVTLVGADQVVTVPVLGLADIHIPSLAELSLEFDCVVEQSRQGAKNALALRMVREGSKRAYRLKIGMRAEERIVAVVTLDGELIRAYELEFEIGDS